MGYVFSEDLCINNYTQLNIDDFSEVCKIQSYKEVFLKEFDSFYLNPNGIMKMSMKKDGSITLDPKDNKNDTLILRKTDISDEDFEKLKKRISHYPDAADSLIFSGQKPKENLQEENNYEFRIYDSAIFLHEDFLHKKIVDEDGEEKTLFQKYEKFLFDYVEKTKNPFTVYYLSPFDGDVLTKFENFSINGIDYNINHRFSNENLNKVLYFLDRDRYNQLQKESDLVLTERGGELEIPSIREQLLINFWHSMLYHNQFEKFDDVKMIFFFFFEKLETIEIDM